MGLPQIARSTYDGYVSHKYFSELDGMRGIGVLAVITAHMHDRWVWDWVGPHRALDMFFVASGYLITVLALREEAQRGSLSLKAFYIRRCFRILPMYYLVLALYCLLIFGIGLKRATAGPMLQGALPWYTFYMNEVPYFYGIAGHHRDIPFYQSWSLGIEEKFYALWPVLGFVLWRGNFRRRVVGSLTLATAAVALPYLMGDQPLAGSLAQYFNILLGCTLAFLLEHRASFERMRFLSAPGWLYATLVPLLAIQFAVPVLERTGHRGAVPPVHSIYSVLMAVFLACVLLGRGPVQRLLVWRPIVYVGRICYGMYLIHILCLNAAERVFRPGTGNLAVSLGAYALACLLTLGGAVALNRVFEKPLMDVGRRWSKRVAATRAAKAAVVAESA